MKPIQPMQDTPPSTRNGVYLAKILSVTQDADAIYIHYEFALGENAGWATNKYIQTGQWIFSQRIDRKYGKKALQAFLAAITEPTQAGNPSPQYGEGRWVWVDVEWSQYGGRWFPRVKRVYPPDTYQPMAKDFWSYVKI